MILVTDFNFETKINMNQGFKSLQFNDEKTNSIIEKNFILFQITKQKGKKNDN